MPKYETFEHLGERYKLHKITGEMTQITNKGKFVMPAIPDGFILDEKVQDLSNRQD